jgi:hypothetical protein
MSDLPSPDELRGAIDALDALGIAVDTSGFQALADGLASGDLAIVRTEDVRALVETILSGGDWWLRAEEAAGRLDTHLGPKGGPR